MTDIQELLKEMREGLEGVTPGVWDHGCFADDKQKCNCKYIFAECFMGSVAVISVDNGLHVGDGGNDCPPPEQAKANMRHIARCNPVNIKVLLDYIEELEGDVNDQSIQKRPTHIAWHGDGLPFPSHYWVHVKLRNGEVKSGQVEMFDWGQSGSEFDIISYDLQK